MKMPIRFNIVNQLLKHPAGMTPQEVYKTIKDVYTKERDCTPKVIDKQLMSMKGAGLTEIAQAEYDGTGQLVVTYRITSYGENLARQAISAFLD